MQRAIDLHSRGDLAEAIAILEEGITSLDSTEYGPELTAATNYLANLSEMAGQPSVAIDYVMKALAVSPHDLGLLYKLAWSLILTRQAAEAHAAVEKFRVACESSTDKLRSSWAELQDGLERRLAELKESA